MLPIELGIGETVKLEFQSTLDLPLVEPITLEAIVRNRNVFRYGFEFAQPGAGSELLRSCNSFETSYTGGPAGAPDGFGFGVFCSGFCRNSAIS